VAAQCAEDMRRRARQVRETRRGDVQCNVAQIQREHQYGFASRPPIERRSSEFDAQRQTQRVLLNLQMLRLIWREHQASPNIYA